MITRSFGITPGLPWSGPLPGGGYKGKTRRLDRAVQRFAEWLHERIAGPVQIRFNSDRLSGGAFVYPGFTPDATVTFDTAEIGLAARLITPPAVRTRRDRTPLAKLTPLEWEDCWIKQTPLHYSVLIYPQFLRFPADFGEHKPGDQFAYWTVTTPQEAYRLLKRLINLPVR